MGNDKSCLKCANIETEHGSHETVGWSFHCECKCLIQSRWSLS